MSFGAAKAIKNIMCEGVPHLIFVISIINFLIIAILYAYIMIYNLSFKCIHYFVNRKCHMHVVDFGASLLVLYENRINTRKDIASTKRIMMYEIRSIRYQIC